MTNFPEGLSPTGKALMLTEELFKTTKAFLEADSLLQDALQYEYPVDNIRELIEKMTDAKSAYNKANDAVYDRLRQGFYDEADILRMNGLEIVNGKVMRMQ